MNKEAIICAAGVAKLKAEGWRCCCEIPQHNRLVDCAAVRDGKLLIMEAKTGFTKGLKRQLQNCDSDFVIGIIRNGIRHESIQWCRDRGVGLWHVIDSLVFELVKPVQKTDFFPWRREQLMERFERYQALGDREAGGLPCQKGIGPAQFVQANIDEYRAAHPKATWKEIFAAVPSHYRTAGNMYSALRLNAMRLAYRDRMKARKLAESEQ